MSGKYNLAAYSAVLGATLFWGLSHVITKFVVAEFNPFAVVAFRICCASVILIAVQKLRGKVLLPLLKNWKKLLVLGIAGIFVSQFGFILGLSFTTPAHGSLVYTLSPIVTALLAFAFKSERLRFWQIVGIFLAFTGAILLATEGGINLENHYFIGDMIMFGAMVGWSYYTVFAGEVIREYGSVNTLTMSFLFAVPFALAVGFMPMMQSDLGDVSWKGWSALSYLVIFGTVLSVHLFTYSLKHLKPITVSVFVYLQPVIATIGAHYLLGEEITVRFLIAAFLVFSGLYFFTIYRMKQKAAT